MFMFPEKVELYMIVDLTQVFFISTFKIIVINFLSLKGIINKI